MLTAKTIENVYSEHNLTENEIYANLLKANSETVIQVTEMAQCDKDAVEALTIYLMVLAMINGSLKKEDYLDDNIDKVCNVLKEKGFRFQVNHLLGAFRVISPYGQRVFNFENITMRSIFKFISKN